jgi:hypothetical protein
MCKRDIHRALTPLVLLINGSLLGLSSKRPDVVMFSVKELNYVC